jgi:hypothetical protein
VAPAAVNFSGKGRLMSDRFGRPARGKAALLGFVVAAFALSIWAASASAAAFAPPDANDLLQIQESNQLGCQLFHNNGDGFDREFDTGEVVNNYCGTYIGFNDGEIGDVWGDQTADEDANHPFTPESQTTGGSGTAADPYTITTVVHAVQPATPAARQLAAAPAGSLLTLTEVESYVSGDDFYRTDVTVHNDTGGTLDPVLYHAGDCNIKNDDFGLADEDSAAGPVFCTPDVPVEEETTEGVRTAASIDDPSILGFIPVGTDSKFIEASDNDDEDDDSALNDAIDGTSFDNSCQDCKSIPGEDQAQDNGVGLSWALSLPGGGDARRCFYTVDSWAGNEPDVPSSCTPTPARPPTIAQQAPPTCALRISRARVFLFTRHPRLRLVARYRTAAPADVKINFKAIENGKKVDLGDVTRHFSGHGLFRLPKQLTEDESNALFDTHKFVVHFKIPGEPGFCQRKYRKELTIPRIVDGQRVVFQSDSKFGPGSPGHPAHRG